MSGLGKQIHIQGESQRDNWIQPLHIARRESTKILITVRKCVFPTRRLHCSGYTAPCAPEAPAP